MAEDTYISPFWNMCWAEESSFKAAVNMATASIPKFIGINFTQYDILLPDRKFEQKYGGSSAKPIFTIEKNREFKATYEWMIQNAQLMKQLMGKLVTTGAGPYTHTFTCGDQDARPLPSIAIAFWHDLDGDAVYDAQDTMIQYGGTRIPKFDFTFAEGEENPLKLSADFWCCVPSEPGAFPNASYTKLTTAPYIMNKNSNLLNIYGANYAKIKSGRVTVDHSPDFRWYEDGRHPSNIVCGEVKFEIELIVDVMDRSLYAKAMETAGVGESGSTIKTNVTLSFLRGTDTITFNITGAVLNTSSSKGEKTTEATLTGTFEDLNIVFVDGNSAYPL